MDIFPLLSMYSANTAETIFESIGNSIQPCISIKYLITNEAEREAGQSQL